MRHSIKEGEQEEEEKEKWPFWTVYRLQLVLSRLGEIIEKL